MSVHHARIIALAAALVGISSLGPLAACDGPRQTPDEQQALADGDGEAAPEIVLDLRVRAEQGDADAQVFLGNGYAAGRGVAQDYVQAHLWFNLAASRSTGDIRECAVKGRDVAAALLTLDSLNEAQRLAREWDAAHPRR